MKLDLRGIAGSESAQVPLSVFREQCIRRIRSWGFPQEQNGGRCSFLESSQHVFRADWLVWYLLQAGPLRQAQGGLSAPLKYASLRMTGHLFDKNFRDGGPGAYDYSGEYDCCFADADSASGGGVLCAACSRVCAAVTRVGADPLSRSIERAVLAGELRCGTVSLGVVCAV